MEQAIRILVVEDDDDIRDLLGGILESGGYTVDVISSSQEALKKVQTTKYDLMLIERIMPDLSGLEVIQALKGMNLFFPVLLLTTQADTHDIIAALDQGADDYLQKPFERNCLLARVRTLIKRFNPLERADSQKLGKLTLGQLVINTKTFDVFAGNERIQLTPSEFKLLEALASHKGSVLTRERLIELVQGQGIAVIDRAIDTHVFGLRKKLGQSAELVETVRGIGYRINA